MPTPLGEEAEGEGLHQNEVAVLGSPGDGVARISALVCGTDEITGIERSIERDADDIASTVKMRWPRPSTSTPTMAAGATSESVIPRPSVIGSVVAEVATFFDVFGLLGVPMIIVFVLSAGWTFTLAVIQVHTNEMANSIMNTTEFDNGQFWSLPQPDTALIFSSVVLLALFGAGYTWLVVTMLFFYRAGSPAVKLTTQENNKAVPATTESHTRDGSKFQRFVVWLHHQCDLPADIRQHYVTAALDLPKLIFQTTTLYTYLDKGFPTPIIYFYSVLLLCNWLVACYRSQRYVEDPALIIARLYYTFDLFFAVFAPLVILLYFISSFRFDRGAFLTKTETLASGGFDTVARLFADPSEISSFCSAFHYLQFSSGSTLFYKSALNLLSLYKWRKIIMTLIHNHAERQLERKRKASVGPVQTSGSRDDSVRAAFAKKVAASSFKSKLGKHFAVKLLLALTFLLPGVGNFGYSIIAVQSTADLCSKYDKCRVASYQWNLGQKHCTCLVFAAREMAPKTFAEWTDPVDITADLTDLAIAGELRIVQIISRAVPELPEELKNCRYLEQLILAYTKTEQLPVWLSEFSRLEYIHIEGDFTSRRLTTIPDGSFDNMHRLAFLHLGGIPEVETLPSFSSLTSLRYLTLAVLTSLKEIPSFDGLSRVSDLNIIDASRATTLPSLAPLTGLSTMGLRPKSAVCCNGFISGTCNFAMDQCLAVASDKFSLTCTDARISADDKAKLESFGSSVCPNSIVEDREATAPSKYTTDELCGGVMFKECSLSGVQGICYNTRMMVINCETTSGYIAMRKLQIERGVGDSCDPQVEAWLGCTSSS